jgi:hypothetical protein
MAVQRFLTEDECAHRAVMEFMIADMMLGYGSGIDTPYWEEQATEHRKYIEIEFGMDALENTAQYAVATRMTSDEIVVWVGTQWPQVKRVMRGEESA